MKSNKNNEETGKILIPKMQNFFKNKQKNTSLTWIPVESALIFDTNFQQLTTPTKAIFLQLFLLCGVLGNYELPFNINYLARILGVDRCRIRNSLSELFTTGLCVENTTFREKEREKEQKQTDTHRERQETSDEGVVGVDYSDLGNEISDVGLESQVKIQTKSIEKCLKYVEVCISKGDKIDNPRALANHLFKTGESDAFILATLFPEKQEELDRETYGEPRQFSDEPCKVCYGAKMADPDGKGYRKCDHCRDEKGKATGLEPGENGKWLVENA